MSAATWIGIGLLGGLGAVARFLTELRLGDAWGVFAVNLGGAFLLGLLSGAPVLAIGFLGALTTFSSWMRTATPFLVASQLTLGLLAVWCGDLIRP